MFKYVGLSFCNYLLLIELNSWPGVVWVTLWDFWVSALRCGPFCCCWCCNKSKHICTFSTSLQLPSCPFQQFQQSSSRSLLMSTSWLYSLGFRKPLLVVAPAEACEQVCWCYLISFLSRHLGVFLTGCDERRADLTSSLYTLCLTTRQSQVVEPMKHSVAKITNWA